DVGGKSTPVERGSACAASVCPFPESAFQARFQDREMRMDVRSIFRRRACAVLIIAFHVCNDTPPIRISEMRFRPALPSRCIPSGAGMACLAHACFTHTLMPFSAFLAACCTSGGSNRRDTRWQLVVKGGDRQYRFCFLAGYTVCWRLSEGGREVSG